MKLIVLSRETVQLIYEKIQLKSSGSKQSSGIQWIYIKSIIHFFK